LISSVKNVDALMLMATSMSHGRIRTKALLCLFRAGLPPHGDRSCAAVR
jgi:hypothetical protein